MRQLLFLCIAFCILIFSCSKNSEPSGTVSSFNIVNGVVGSGSVVPNFGPGGINYTIGLKVPYAAYHLYSPPTGSAPLSIAQIADTTNPFFNGTLTLQTGSIYSMFLCGSSTAPDTLFTKDNIVTYTDSTTGVRFVNLVQDKLPVTVNVLDATQPLATLSYRDISGFLTMPSTADNMANGYVFEFRNAADSVLLTYYFSPVTFKNITLTLVGSLDPAQNTSLGIISVPNY